MNNQIKAMNTVPSECKGCIEADICHIIEKCSYQCPCTECLIKVMCNEPCKKFEKVYNKAIQLHNAK